MSPDNRARLQTLNEGDYQAVRRKQVRKGNVRLLLPYLAFCLGVLFAPPECQGVIRLSALAAFFAGAWYFVKHILPFIREDMRRAVKDMQSLMRFRR